ncbi:MAG: cytochrome C [Methylibium sp.]|nr:cytochrome C [Methylibium sp.]
MKGLLFAAALVLAMPSAQASVEAAMTKAGCMACHAKDKKLVGPSFKDVAANYKGQDVVAALAQKVRAGGKGVYGPIPMPPTGPDKISDGDLKEALTWVLKQ